MGGSGVLAIRTTAQAGEEVYSSHISTSTNGVLPAQNIAREVVSPLLDRCIPGLNNRRVFYLSARRISNSNRTHFVKISPEFDAVFDFWRYGNKDSHVHIGLPSSVQALNPTGKGGTHANPFRAEDPPSIFPAG